MEIDIRLGEVSYPFVLDTDWMEPMVERLLALGASHYLVVADSNTGPLYGADLVDRLARSAPASLLTHPAGEPGKHLGAVTGLMESALATGIDRASVVVALGGGVTGNMAGLMAALLFRGVRLVHVPTSLIAMLDSTLSIKQAVNASVGKNLIGTFYPPVEVLADTAVLRTLPRREVVAGLCEAVKNALAIRPQMADVLLAGLRPDGSWDEAAMRTIILECVAAKAEVTADDQRECRSGLVLEYGHTVGHALEHTSAGLLSHGEAIGLGMIVAAETAQRLSHLDGEAVGMHRALLAHAGATTTVPEWVDLDRVMDRLRYDNKRGYLHDLGEDCAMVLLRGLGQPVWGEQRPLVPVPMALVGEVLADLTATPAAEPAATPAPAPAPAATAATAATPAPASAGVSAGMPAGGVSAGVSAGVPAGVGAGQA